MARLSPLEVGVEGNIGLSIAQKRRKRLIEVMGSTIDQSYKEQCLLHAERLQGLEMEIL